LILTTESEFDAVGLFDKNSKNYDAGHKLINALLASDTQSITSFELKELVPFGEIRDKLLEKNVFAFHPSTGKITFQSQLALTYAKIKIQK